jgi:type I restriction enzyme, S subunit
VIRNSDRVATKTGGREAATRHIPPKLALAVGLPSTPAPIGWEWRQLSDLARLESGHTPSRRHPEYWGGSVPWISIRDAKANHGSWIDETDETINDLGLINSSARLIPSGAVCLSRTASVGYVVITGKPMATSQDFVNWICGADLDPRFLQYLFLAEGEDLLRFASGAVHQTIYFPEAKAFSVCVPGIEVQRRIVAILDEAFEGIATAKANAEKNLQNARELAAALGEACFEQSTDLSFASRQLAELCELIVDCEHKTAPVQDKGYPSIRTPNIGRGKLLLDGVNRVSEETYVAWTRRAIPLPGDLIFAREAPAGNVAVIPDDLRVCLGQRTVLIRPRREVFEPEYLAHLLLQRGSQQRLLAHSRGATVQHVNMKDIRAFNISFVPPLPVQRKAIDQLLEIEQTCEAMEQLHSRKLAALDELKKSLLHQAFTGAL